METDKNKIQVLSWWWELLCDNQYALNEYGTEKLKSLLKEYSMEEIKLGMSIASESFTKTENKIDKESVEECFNKIGGICYNRNLPLLKRKKTHLINLIGRIHGTEYKNHIEEMVDDLFCNMKIIQSENLQLSIVEKLVFPIVKDSSDIVDCLTKLDTFTNENFRV